MNDDRFYKNLESQGGDNLLKLLFKILSNLSLEDI